MSGIGISRNRARSHRNRGFALLLVMLLALGVIGVLLVTHFNIGAAQVARNRTSDEALRIASEGLIAYAAGRDFSASTPKPGTLPCPDLNDDGVAEGSCGLASDRPNNKIAWVACRGKHWVSPICATRMANDYGTPCPASSRPLPPPQSC